MNLDIGLLIGLLAIAISIFLGLIFGLSGFRRGVTSELSTIKEAVVAIRGTVEKTWDLILIRFGTSGGTVERELDKLGKIKITAEPAPDETAYMIQIQQPIFKEGPLRKKFKEEAFVRTEKRLIGEEGTFYVLSPNRLRYILPNTDPRACTEFITFVLKELNSTYFELLGEEKDFEEPILS